MYEYGAPETPAVTPEMLHEGAKRTPAFALEHLRGFPRNFGRTWVSFMRRQCGTNELDARHRKVYSYREIYFTSASSTGTDDARRTERGIAAPNAF